MIIGGHEGDHTYNEDGLCDCGMVDSKGAAIRRDKYPALFDLAGSELVLPDTFSLPTQELYRGRHRAEG